MKKWPLFNMMFVAMFAGMLDVTMFSHFNVMSSPQTGNLVQLAWGLTHGSHTIILHSGLILLAFIIGTFVMQKFKRYETVVYIAFNVLTLIAIAWIHAELVVMVMISVLLGAQLEMYREVRGVAVNSTIMTGNLRKAVEPLSGQVKTHTLETYLPTFVILSFFVGALIGSFEITILGVSLMIYSIMLNIGIHLNDLRK